jgi:hypothetical protein
VAALIDRLGTRLGRERVRRIHPRDSHIPEQPHVQPDQVVSKSGIERIGQRLDPLAEQAQQDRGGAYAGGAGGTGG